MKTLIQLHLLALLACFGCGCATSDPADPYKAKVLEPKGAAIGAPNLAAYDTVTVVPFEVVEGPAVKNIPKEFGSDLAGDIVARLRSDYAGVFREVNYNKPTKQPGELIVTGRITAYNPGDPNLRDAPGLGAVQVGLWVAGAASYKAELVLKDGRDGREIFSAPFDKLWSISSDRTVANMVAQNTASITKTIAVWKGWQAAGK